MLVGGDLGFPYLVVVVLVVVVVPVIGFVVRRKWRHAVARREEIRRLLILASEEAARAELEAKEEYYYTTTTTAPVAPVSFPVSAAVSFDSPLKPQYQTAVPFDSSLKPQYHSTVSSDSPLKPQYQCAVCFRPTTTRCANCKAVRYCSGKCQIIHWRQGHKDECRPYVAVSAKNNVGGSSYKQEDGKDHNESFNTEGQQIAKSIERSQTNGVESLARRQGTDSTYESASDSLHEGFSTFTSPTKSFTEPSSTNPKSYNRVDLHRFSDVTSDNFEAVKPEHQNLVSPPRKSTGSETVKQKKSKNNDEGTRSRSSSSSCQTDDGSNQSLFSETSTTSSGFWSGTIHSKKFSTDELDDSAPSSSKDVVNRNTTDYQPSLRFSFDMKKSGPNPAKAFTAASIIQDEPGSTVLGSKGSNDEATLSKEVSNDGLKSRRPPTCTSEMLKGTDTDPGSNLAKSEYRESKLFSPVIASHHASAGEVPLKAKVAKTFSGVSSTLERSKHDLNNKGMTSHTSKSMGVGIPSTKASGAHSRALESIKSIEVNDDKDPVATCSTQLKEHPRIVRSGLKTSMLKVVDQLKPSKLSRDVSLGGGSETAHRYSCKGLFSYEMFVKLYNWKKIELQPCGLINCGNSCYANAVLQCLAYTPPLTAYLLQGLHSKACGKREWCFTCELESLVLKAKDGISPLSPIRILSQIENIGSNLGRGREEDAHEFLRYAIESLQLSCLREAGANVSNSLEEETTLIGLTFGGYLRSQIKCIKCGGKSERHERIMDLTVEIEGNIGTLEDALDKFTCTEILDGENKYKCGRCKSYEKAKKKLTLLEAPNVLTIALKRFQSGKFGKLNKSIRFPEILDMAPYVSGTSDKSPIYRLYGVVVHIDVMNAAFSGHYVCYVKNVQNRWFKIDDSVVKEVDLHSVLSKGAYMLLYARCSPRAPRSLRSSLNHHHQHDPRKHKPPPPSTQPWNPPNNHLQVRHWTLEDESSSSSSSSSDASGFFSESCSCSTDSSHRDSNSIEDHIFGEWEQDYSISSMNLNSSDSDTSSSSFPSPLYAPSTIFRSRGGGSCKECRNLGRSCNMCRETNIGESSNRGATFRRSAIRGRSD